MFKMALVLGGMLAVAVKFGPLIAKNLRESRSEHSRISLLTLFNVPNGATRSTGGESSISF
jgi:hypothetical protein